MFRSLYFSLAVALLCIGVSNGLRACTTEDFQKRAPIAQKKINESLSAVMACSMTLLTNKTAMVKMQNASQLMVQGDKSKIPEMQKLLKDSICPIPQCKIMFDIQKSILPTDCDFSAHTNATIAKAYADACNENLAHGMHATMSRITVMVGLLSLFMSYLS